MKTMMATAILLALSLAGGAAFANDKDEARKQAAKAREEERKARLEEEKARIEEIKAAKEKIKQKTNVKVKRAGGDDRDIDVDVDVDTPDVDVDVPEPPSPHPMDVDCDGDQKHADSSDDDDCDDDSGATKGPKTVPVKGAVHFRLEAIGSDMRVVASQRKDVTVNAGGCGVELNDSGGDIEAEVDGDCSDPIEVQLPTGSSPELETVDGGLTLKGEFGRVRAATVNGDVQLDKAADLELEVVSGSVNIGSLAGAARINTVSGDVKLRMTNPSPQLKYESVSGALDWGGSCGKGCKLKIQAFSGDVALHLDRNSGFQVQLVSHSGGLDDQLGVKPQKSGGKGAVTVTGTYGTANGQIKVKTYSGELKLQKK